MAWGGGEDLHCLLTLLELMLEKKEDNVLLEKE